jgi:hypothetical protein
LRAQIKLHVGVNGKAVVALLADSPPFAVGLHESLIDSETRPFTDCALYGGEALFDFFGGQGRHVVDTPSGDAIKPQYIDW